jgi:hypothetical protein
LSVSKLKYNRQSNPNLSEKNNKNDKFNFSLSSFDFSTSDEDTSSFLIPSSTNIIPNNNNSSSLDDSLILSSLNHFLSISEGENIPSVIPQLYHIDKSFFILFNILFYRLLISFSF